MTLTYLSFGLPRDNNGVTYCKPIFICEKSLWGLWEGCCCGCFLLQISLQMSLAYYFPDNNTSLLGKLVAMNQFIFGKSQNKVVMNISWFKVIIYGIPHVLLLILSTYNVVRNREELTIRKLHGFMLHYIDLNKKAMQKEAFVNLSAIYIIVVY